MEKRNKLWRKRHQWRLFKKRIILRAALKDYLWDEEGNQIQQPHWYQYTTQKCMFIYKTTGTPCSCAICKSERYNRRDFKKETKRIIKESVE